MRAVTRANVAMFGGEAQHERFRRETMPKILGALFIVFGLAAFVTGVVDLIIGKQLQTG
jgi:putative Ca2+/H+ antiporter (TMEM165/GDT1 family)